MAETEWIEVDPGEIPPPPEPCPIGWTDHVWRLAIEEGEVTLVPVEPCNGTCSWWERHDLFCDDLGFVKLTTATECPGSGWYESGSHYISHPNRCDCNRWIEIQPLRATDREAE